MAYKILLFILGEVVFSLVAYAWASPLLINFLPSGSGFLVVLGIIVLQLGVTWALIRNPLRKFMEE